MARAEFSYYSAALCRPVSFQIIIPNDSQEEWIKDNPHFKREMKTLVLLHGYTGINYDWILNSHILSLAGAYNVAVVCPSGENSFYLDGPETGRKYATFVGEELLNYVHKTFGLSAKKEDNFIGGLSMGGFGALHTALQFPENFGGAFGLSSALIQYEVAKMTPGFDNGMANYEYYRLMFGEPSELENSINNPEELVRRIKKAGTPMPKLYMACGTEDFLLEANRRFHNFLVEENVEVDYHESKGVHDFVFWNEYIEPAVKFMLENM